MRSKAVISLCAVLCISACAENDRYEEREHRIENALRGNAEGMGSAPAWLVKVSSLASDDRTAVFYGYGDNLQACAEFAEEMNESGRQVEYACALMVE